MKRFSYSLPEVGFVVLVMLLPLIVSAVLGSASIWGFVGKLLAGMVVGFCIWLGLVLVVCRAYDRSKRDEKP
jgi:hypothetical protein